MTVPPAPAGDLPHELLELAAERLLGAPEGARARVLEEFVGEHPELEAPLRSLANDLAGAERLLAAGFAQPAEPLQSIGPYRVLRVIGEGAFGVVSLCAQETPVRREVAIKVLRPGTGDRQTLARFEAERHVLATLNHPAIAQVFDAGALPDGRPYFVMEHVRGVPITSYCDTHRLGVDARLSLFVRLCRGVHHAHLQGIVHRDLKPANVLVFEQDGRPQPKIIDFGIAKAVHPTGREDAVHTETGRIVGTPGYMSPEQSAGGRGDLDPRADVFSLGVLLYELLTGELPWGRRPTTTDSEPVRPSLRVATDPTGTAARRAIPARKLASRLRGDLDWIVLRAIERERERRYVSADELALDLERHLRGEPVLAGPPSFGYRLRKFARRRRATLLAAGAVLVVGAIGLWSSLSFRAQAQTRTADLEAAAASLLARANDRSVIQAPQSMALRKALVEDALGFYERFLRERPTDPGLRQSRVRALTTLAQVHWAVGQWAQSETVAREAIADAETLLTADPDRVDYLGCLGIARRNLARALYDQGKAAAARAEFQRAVHDLDQCHARAPGEYYRYQLVRVLREQATTMTAASETDARVAVLRRALELQEAAAAEQPSFVQNLELIDGLTALGQLLSNLGDLSGAQKLLRRAEELVTSTPEAGPPYACTVLGASATLAGFKGNHRSAVERLQKAITAARQWCGQEPTWSRPWGALFDLHGALARAQRAAGNAEAAAATTQAAIAIGEDRIGRFPDDHAVRGQLADLLSVAARERLTPGRRSSLTEAEAWGRRAVTLLATLPDAVDLRTRAHARLQYLHHLGLVLDARGSEAARGNWQEVGVELTAWRERYGVDPVDATMITEATLRVARARFEEGRDQDAGEFLDQAEALLEEHAANVAHRSLRAAQAHRLRALLAARRGDDVRAAWHGEQALAVDAGGNGLFGAAEALHAAWRSARAGDAAARERAAGHGDRALELHRTVIDALRAALRASPDDPGIVVPLGQASIRLAELLRERDQRDAARELLDEALPALAEWRNEAHVDTWDEALYREGQAMAAR